MIVDAPAHDKDEHWYLVHCQPRKEAFAAHSLRHLLQLMVFLPERQIRSRKGIRCVPFFQGYIFTSMDLQKVPRSFVNSCPGVLHLVEFGGAPQAVPQCVIDTIHQQLERLNGLPGHASHLFKPGDIVQIKYGPLQDLEMIFVGSTTPGSRVHVLLELLGRLKDVQVDVDMLEKVPTKSLVSHELGAQRDRITQERARQMLRLA